LTFFRTIDYVRIFNNGIKAFDYFVNKNFHYNMSNALRILDCLNAEDALEYNYNVKYCDWKTYMEVQIKGMRYFFYRESKETTLWHRVMYHM
jgi:fatty acyl-CoA reductase